MHDNFNWEKVQYEFLLLFVVSSPSHLSFELAPKKSQLLTTLNYSLENKKRQSFNIKGKLRKWMK